jgi:hypothetical protein
MRHWDEVRAVLGNEFAVDELGGERVLLSLGDQTVVVELVTEFGQPWITAIAPILPEPELVRPVAAPERSTGLKLEVIEGIGALRWTSALAPLTRLAVDRAMRSIAREATRLRRLNALRSRRQALDLLVG